MIRSSSTPYSVYLRRTIRFRVPWNELKLPKLQTLDSESLKPESRDYQASSAAEALLAGALGLDLAQMCLLPKSAKVLFIAEFRVFLESAHLPNKIRGSFGCPKSKEYIFWGLYWGPLFWGTTMYLDTLNPKPYTLNPKPSALSPKP